MSSILKVDTIQDQSGNNIINENADTITIGASGDTITVPSGATLDASGATLTLPTTIEVDTIEPQSGTSLTIGASGDTITIPSGATITNSGTATGFGKVLQVLQATKQDTQDFALATGTLSDITGLTLSITPSSASNKVLVLFTVHMGQTSGGGANPYVNIDKGGSNIFIGDTTGSRTRGTSNVGVDLNSQYTLKIASQTYLDSPNTTSATTYKLRAGGYDSRSFTINKTVVDNAEGAIVTSTLTLMEIAG